jgi:hypothetical protein
MQSLVWARCWYHVAGIDDNGIDRSVGITTHTHTHTHTDQVLREDTGKQVSTIDTVNSTTNTSINSCSPSRNTIQLHQVIQCRLWNASACSTSTASRIGLHEWISASALSIARNSKQSCLLEARQQRCILLDTTTSSTHYHLHHHYPPLPLVSRAMFLVQNVRSSAFRPPVIILILDCIHNIFTK